MDSRVDDIDTGARPNVESVGVVTTVAIAIGVVDRDSTNSEIVCIIDAEDLDGRVLDIDVLDLRIDHLVGREELGLRLAAVTALSVPPAGTISIEDSSGSSLNGDARSGN